MRTPWRVLAYILIPLGIVISIFGWRIMKGIEAEVEANLVREVEIIGRALQAPIRRAIVEEKEPQIQEALDSVFTIGSVYGAFVYDHDGKLLASVGRGGDDPRYRDYIVEILEGTDNTGRYVNFDDTKVYSAFIPVIDALSGPVGLIQINRDRSEIRSSMGSVRLQGIFLSIAMIFLSAMVVMAGHYIAQGKAVSRLLRSIGKIEKGDRDHRAREEGPKEIASIAKALNRMMASLKTAEEELMESKAVERLLREQASRNDRLVSLGKLAGGVAHELGSPLSVIRGQIRRLRKQSPEPQTDPRQKQCLDRMEQEVRRTEDVVGQLLDFGSPQRRFECVQVRKIIDAALENSATELRENLCDLTAELPDSLPSMEMDRLRFTIALRNLLANAAKHASGTKVVLSVRISASEISFIVRDHGAGIAPGDENRIFEPFISSSGKGYGLGLPLVQQIAREHNGIARACNRDPGAEFRITLPLGHNTEPQRPS
jgi:signal transduction histidine kinase